MAFLLQVEIVKKRNKLSILSDNHELLYSVSWSSYVKIQMYMKLELTTCMTLGLSVSPYLDTR